jgi:protein-tyrosine phosphatase
MTPTTPHPDPVSVLFVCLGNICRSPLAEGVFRHRARRDAPDESIVVDSAGTGGWHVGDPPDPRSTEVARAHGVSLEGQVARRVVPLDLSTFDWIVAMDHDNLAELRSLQARHGGTARVVLLRDFDPEPGDGEVPDPYYGGPGGFDRVFEMVDRSCAALLDTLSDGV